MLSASLNRALPSFTKGEHIVRHQYGLWNGTLSDMLIENILVSKTRDPESMDIESSCLQSFSRCNNRNILVSKTRDIESMDIESSCLQPFSWWNNRNILVSKTRDPESMDIESSCGTVVLLVQ